MAGEPHHSRSESNIVPVTTTLMTSTATAYRDIAAREGGARQFPAYAQGALYRS